MIISLCQAKELPGYSDKTDDEIKNLLDSIEEMVRSKTHNNFQNTNIRYCAGSAIGDIEGYTWLEGEFPYLKVGDTIQITESIINDGLFVIKRIDGGRMELDKPLYEWGHNLITKIEYPASIRQGCINLLKWEAANRSKVGIKSETISRHSVTYYDQDSNNQDTGYPASLVGFLKPYMKARF